jgi:hypothetical protein
MTSEKVKDSNKMKVTETELLVLDKIAYKVCHKYKGYNDFALDELHSLAMEKLGVMKTRYPTIPTKEFRDLYSTALYNLFNSKKNKMKCYLSNSGDITLLSDLQQKPKVNWFERFMDRLTENQSADIMEILSTDCCCFLELKAMLREKGMKVREIKAYTHEMREVINVT